MGLFTDGLVSTVDDLRNYENQILEVATVETIDLHSKSRVAQDMIASEMLAFLGRCSTGGWSLQHLTLKNVAVTEPLRQWHVFQTLSLVYQDVYGNQLSERYKHKVEEYRHLAEWASNLLFQAGIGLVRQPIPKAGRPELTAVQAATGSNALAVCVSWTASAGSAEGSPSDPVAVTLPSGKTLAVMTAAVPPEVSAWNVFVGPSAEEVTRQNDVPLPISATWQLPAEGLRQGPKTGRGQAPDWYLRPDQVLHRG